MFVFGPLPPPAPTPRREPAAVAVGAYDGVHRGHQVCLRHLREGADHRGLAAGDVAGASRLLGRPHEMRGVVELGDQRGRTLGFPTANMAIPSTLVIPC